MAKKARRTTHRSSAGKKLYAVRDKGGRFKDIQTYERAHRADLARTSKAEGGKKASAKKAAKKAVRRAKSAVRGAVKSLRSAVRQAMPKRPAKKVAKKAAKKSAKKG